jgi:hypothetical protein
MANLVRRLFPKHYMSYDVFNLGVVTCLRTSIRSGEPVEKWVSKLCDIHRKTLVDDGFEQEMLEAANWLKDDISRRTGILHQIPDDFYLKWLQYFIRYYPNGMKYRRPTFAGTYFSSPRVSLPNRYAELAKAYLMFTVQAGTRVLALPPKGWRL